MAMTDKKIREILDRYKTYLDAKQGIENKALGEERRPFVHIDAFCHLRYMLDQMYGFLEQGKREKLMRWIGFMQGVFWRQGNYTLKDLKNQSRPDEGQEE